MTHTLGIMQPYFFPYLGYFQLIASVEQGLLFDIVHYQRQSWMNRNRVLDAQGGWQYINVPVTLEQGRLIEHARVLDRPGALRRIKGQLEHYRKKAPFFRETLQVLEHTFALCQSDSLTELNARSLQSVCDYLGMDFTWKRCSALQLPLPEISYAGQWALEISQLQNARCYINAPGGRAIFRPQDWLDRGIELRFLALTPLVYDPAPYPFVENLSILDVMMWNAPQTIMAFIREQTRVVP
ncbi:WbqC family protein [Pseudomonas ovata]|uniref:WbqC family protein n=1 Tax=Pseudomonas ovata TaxID=1839709 RepID=UPI000D698E50|nr:WbqC family protein [Pseudomonas ovata]